MIHPSFDAWVKDFVVPLKQSHPAWQRLDGLVGGGNRTVVSKFRHAGRVWVVHGDSHFEPIFRAHAAVTSGMLADPFEIKPAKARDTLDLSSALPGRNRPKHFYAYG